MKYYVSHRSVQFSDVVRFQSGVQWRVVPAALVHPVDTDNHPRLAVPDPCVVFPLEGSCPHASSLAML